MHKLHRAPGLDLRTRQRQHGVATGRMPHRANVPGRDTGAPLRARQQGVQHPADLAGPLCQVVA